MFNFIVEVQFRILSQQHWKVYWWMKNISEWWNSFPSTSILNIIWVTFSRVSVTSYYVPTKEFIEFWNLSKPQRYQIDNIWNLGLQLWILAKRVWKQSQWQPNPSEWQNWVSSTFTLKCVWAALDSVKLLQNLTATLNMVWVELQSVLGMLKHVQMITFGGLTFTLNYEGANLQIVQMIIHQYINPLIHWFIYHQFINSSINQFII